MYIHNLTLNLNHYINIIKLVHMKMQFFKLRCLTLQLDFWILFKHLSRILLMYTGIRDQLILVVKNCF